MTEFKVNASINQLTRNNASINTSEFEHFRMPKEIFGKENNFTYREFKIEIYLF